MTKVLIVEDDHDLQQMLAQLLNLEGFHVTTASNGREGLERLHAADHPPCLILLDLMMPVMNGWEFRQEQKRDPSVASIPIVVLSALSRTQPRVRTLDAAAYIEKPIEFDKLVDTIRRCCPPTP